MVQAPVHEWGRRLSDALRAAIRAGDLARARGLALEGDGQARSLATEYTYLSRGLGSTTRVLLRLLRETLADVGGADEPARAELVMLVDRLSADLGGFVRDRLGAPPDEEPASTGIAAAAARAAGILDAAQPRFEVEQARLAGEIVAALDAEDGARALALLDRKEHGQYAPLRARLVLFMAESFGWVLRHRGDRGLLRFHLAAAERQRAGFEKWQGMTARELAWTTAFLLKQHLGQVSVREDDEKFTIEQAPCGSGGRLRIDGAYDGPRALPFVEAPGPLTFGESRLPVYCSHCAIWNAQAPLRWFGRPLWILDRPARADGGCTVCIYVRPDGAPRAYVARITHQAGDGAAEDPSGAAAGLTSDRARRNDK